MPMTGAEIAEVRRVEADLTMRDRLGAWGVRWGVRRMDYRVEPGLVALGSPGPQSPVLVSANYKLSFDRLRAVLAGRDAWILVLDTRGVNVWCSAGKGTFGTDEVVRRVSEARLPERVSHRTLILPQLAAPGVSAHEVRDRCGWSVVYGPVRADDLPRFLDSGMQATPEDRRVRFSMRERLAVIPIELVGSLRYLMAASLVFLALSGFGSGGYALDRIGGTGVRAVMLLVVGVLCGAVLVPAFLPWIPGRAFALKGAWIGMAVAVVLSAMDRGGPGLFDNAVERGGWILLIPAISSFLAMNFTGASTYTSLSGVRREVRVAVPFQIVAAVGGLALWVIGRFV